MVSGRKRIALLTTIALATLIGASGPQSCSQTPYVATVRWTSYGIPHVRASNWGSLGYGYGFAFARDRSLNSGAPFPEAMRPAPREWVPAGGRGRPLQPIAVEESVEFVMKDGEIHERRARRRVGA
jgi:hypothetical protein